MAYGKRDTRHLSRRPAGVAECALAGALPRLSHFCLLSNLERIVYLDAER
jgi:hypothetical protein